MAKRPARKPKHAVNSIDLAEILPQPVVPEVVYDETDWDSIKAQKRAETTALRLGTSPALRPVPIARKVPVLLITHPQTFQQEHRFVLRQALRDICKEHHQDGKTFFEVGEEDDLIEGTIEFCIKFLAGYGIDAERSVEQVPVVNLADPRATW